MADEFVDVHDEVDVVPEAVSEFRVHSDGRVELGTGLHADSEPWDSTDWVVTPESSNGMVHVQELDVLDRYFHEMSVVPSSSDASGADASSAYDPYGQTKNELDELEQEIRSGHTNDVQGVTVERLLEAIQLQRALNERLQSLQESVETLTIINTSKDAEGLLVYTNARPEEPIRIVGPEVHFMLLQLQLVQRYVVSDYDSMMKLSYLIAGLYS